MHNYVFCLQSDENFFTLDELQYNSTYNITVLAFNANNQFSVIAKAQQYSTLQRGYKPGMVKDIHVESFHPDTTNGMRLGARLTWQPAAGKVVKNEFTFL